MTENIGIFLALKEAVQSRPSLRLSQCHIVGNHMPLLKWFTDDELRETESGSAADQCKACFKVSKLKPLANNGFDVIHEWLFEVPIEVLILLELFINKKSLRTAPNRQAFVQKKLNKAHTIYDQLWNVDKRNYFGIQQKTNTN